MLTSCCCPAVTTGRSQSSMPTGKINKVLFVLGSIGLYTVPLGENLTKIENILTHWSVAQAGSNDEKKLEVENLVGLSFKFTNIIIYNHRIYCTVYVQYLSLSIHSRSKYPSYDISQGDFLTHNDIKKIVHVSLWP